MSESSPPAAKPADDGPSNFVRELIASERQAGQSQRVATRFPPEPNGYLHVGHAKSICLNFGTALEFGGTCNLRFDDTNPTKEDTEYVDSIQEDVKWLGFSWDDRLFFASDYFQRIHDIAVDLIQRGLAYVDEQDVEAIRAQRGNFYKPGENSPYRDRPVAESLDLFARMKAGEFPDGKMVLRAKIDMAHPNLNLRDPPIYRIRHAEHHRTGKQWVIYPMYDFAHGYCDAFEGITHSVCTLEFEDHRPLYDWLIDQIELPVPGVRPRQIEFARLNLTYTVLSKRKLLQLVEQKHVDGWDDPRMPTLAGMRRRGYTPAALRNFCERVGVSRRDSVVDVSLLEHALRDDLEKVSPRALGVLRPLKVVIENFGENDELVLDAANHPEDASKGSRQLRFHREIYVDRDDFMEVPAKKWFRLAPGAEVRLRFACLIRCKEVVKDAAGNVIELRCTWDPASKGGNAPDGRKVKGTIHWVSAKDSVPATVRLYDRLFTAENPNEGEFLSYLNPKSLETLTGARLEPSLANASAGAQFQLERTGYFCVDKDSKPGAIVLNQTIGLKDGWAKIVKKEGE